MANIPRAPFYVPRPAEDQLWLAASKSNIIPLSTAQKFFGQGGQVPAKQWRYDYNAAESFWNFPPQSSAIIPLSTAQKFFGRGGQAPGKQWHYDYDDASAWWRWNNRDQVILSVTPAKPTTPVFWNFNNDDSSIWSGKPVANSLVTPILTVGGITGGTFYVPRPGDEPYWSGAPLEAATPYMPATAPKPPVPVFWQFNNDDAAASWQQPIQRNVALPFVPKISAVFWPQFNNDDPPMWVGSPIFSKTLHPLLTAGGQIQSHQWLFGYDDPAYWVGYPVNVASPIPMLTAGGIIKAKQWRWDHDVGETFWNIPPERSAAIPMLTTGGVVKARQLHWDNDDPSMWSGWDNRNLINFATVFVQPNPFLPVFWRFNNDDPPPWRQPPQRNIGLPFVPAIVDHWRLDIPDDQPWTLTTQRDSVVSSVQPKPFISVAWRFNNDDPPPWQQPSQRSAALPFVPSVVNRWRLDVPDDQPWSLTTRQDLVLSSVQPNPFISVGWRFNNDDQSPWQQPRSSALTFAAIAASPFSAGVWRFNFDEAAIWQKITFRSIALPTVPAVNNRRRLDITADEPWTALIHRDLSIAITATAPPPPFTIRQPSFAYDDFSSWRWLPPNNRNLPYTFVNSPRVATAPAEMRAADAPVELRTAGAPAETRSADAPAEIRSADAPAEVRSADAPTKT